MDISNLNNRLMCIEYPGIVKNIDYMLQTLGGLNQISETFNHEPRRLQLKFRPNNIFAKPTFGDRAPVTGILIKVKIRRPKKSKLDAKVEVIATTLLGVVERVYKFDSICDFQYLPLLRNSTTNKRECIYNELIPRGMVSMEWITEPNSGRYFLPPVSFSRLDSSTTQLFRKEQLSKENDDTADDGLIGRRRNRRIKQASYIPFSLTDPIPQKPIDPTSALDFLKLKFVKIEQYNLVKELFDRRPVVSKMVASYETKIPNDKLKYILPTLGYYYTTGPWRIMWVRFGYDPRKDFESRYYQQLDYRVRMHIGVRERIESKRERVNILKRNPTPSTNYTEKLKRQEILYYPFFEVDRLPQSRQCIYQYCDIRLAKVQEMLDKIPTPLSGATCSEKSGWLPAGFDDQCREIITGVIRELIAKDQDNEHEFGEEQDEEMSDEEDEPLEETIDYSDNDLDITVNE